MGKVKTHSKLSCQQHSGLAYLPDGWEFAIITIKPAKGYKNTEQSDERQISLTRAPIGSIRELGSQRTCGFGR